jgi:hypothetical protein
MTLSDASQYLPKQVFDVADYHADIERENCIFVEDRETGLVAHVFGRNVSRGEHEEPLTPANAREVLANAAQRFTIPIDGRQQLDEVLAAVETIKGRHEYDGAWKQSEVG